MKTRAEAAPLILSLGLAGFVVMADNWVVSPIVPSIARDVGASPVRTAVLITAYMLPFALFQLLYGPLADRYGKLRVMRLTLIGFTIAAAITALGAGLTDLTIYRALTGAFAAATMPVSLALIGDTVRMEERQGAIGSFMGISFLGQGLSMGIGGAIAFLLSWRGVFLAYASLSAIVTALLIVRSRGLAVSGNPRSEIIAPYRNLLTQGRSLRTYLVVLVEGILIMGSFSYLGAYLSHRFGLDNLAIGATMTAFGLAAIIAGRKSGGIAGRIGRRQTLVIGLLLAALGDGVIFVLGGTFVAVVLAIALLGTGFMFAHSTLLTLATEFAAKARGTAMSLVAFCMMGGGAIGTGIGGRLVEANSFESFYGLWSALLLGLALAAFVAVSDTLAQPSPELAPHSKRKAEEQA
ncbi:MAG: MFS transporter [Chloroflexi bacterium]|nr:MFS transporter [Chloroflexota bacterium]MDA8187064.1 MFS transporter [Dehalococcoidales bacterium]